MAILPIILATQIPLKPINLVPSDWKQTLHFGVKWTSLLVNSLAAGSNDEIKEEPIPDGVATTTVAMAILPEPADLHLNIDQQVQMAQCQIARAKTMKVQKEFKRLEMLEIRIKTI
jgi:hypothetical protein